MNVPNQGKYKKITINSFAISRKYLILQKVLCNYRIVVFCRDSLNARLYKLLLTFKF